MSLHTAIMNVPVGECFKALNFNHRLSYKIGHRDARHAAAELSIKCDAEIDRLQAINAELLVACEAVIAYDDDETDPNDQQMLRDYAIAIHKCRAAIVNATGEKK